MEEKQGDADLAVQLIIAYLDGGLVRLKERQLCSPDETDRPHLPAPCIEPPSR